MRRLVLTLSSLALLTGVLAGSAGAALAADTPTSGYIVVFNDSVNTDAQTNDLQGHYGFKSTFRYGAALRGFAARLTSNQAAIISRLPFIKMVSADGVVHATATAPVVAGETVPTGVRRIEAGTSVVAHAASSVAVAVIDTGVQLANPDLNVTSGTNCISPGQPANDDNGHGTHVAGTIAGRNSGSSVVGVAPGTKIYAVKVLNASGSGSFSSIICGINWVTANTASLNIKVASMSLGGTGSNDTNCGNNTNDSFHKAICNSTNAGVTYVVAAGNSNAPIVGSAPFVPAAYGEVLTVTAVTDSNGAGGGGGGSPACRSGEVDDQYASFSNYSTTLADQNHTIAGPGTCILSDWNNGGTNTISGTSMATPHVSGAVALCLGQGGASGPCSGLTPAQIIQKMRSDAASHTAAVPGYGFTGDPAHAVSGRYYGYMVWAGSDLVATPPTTGTISGTVTKAAGGLAISGATVSVSGVPSTTTNVSGAYTLNGVAAGSASVTVTAAGYTSQTLGVAVTAGQTTTQNFALVATPPTTGAVSGTVTNAAGGAAISGATVSVSGVPSTTTNVSGAYTLNGVAAGAASVTVTAAGYTSQTVAVTVTAGQTTTQNVALVVTPPTKGTISGTVTNAAGGAAISGATVFVSGVPSTITNVSGGYTLNGVAPGSASVTVTAAGYTSQTLGVTVTAGQTTTQNFALVATSQVTAPGAPLLTAVTNPRSCFLGIFCSGGGVKLTWTTPASNGSVISGYRVFRATTPVVSTTGSPLTTTTSTTYTDTTRNATYYYAIVAVNALGPGPASNVASAPPG